MSRGSRDNNSILSELEWDEGLSMPVANAENKALEDEVKKKKSETTTKKNKKNKINSIPQKEDQKTNYGYSRLVKTKC